MRAYCTTRWPSSSSPPWRNTLTKLHGPFEPWTSSGFLCSCSLALSCLTLLREHWSPGVTTMQSISVCSRITRSAPCASPHISLFPRTILCFSGIVSLFLFEFMLEHYYVYNLSVDSKVAWNEAFKTLALLSVTSSSAVTMWSALCPCGASVRTSCGAALFFYVADVWLCISCRFPRCRSCF